MKAILATALIGILVFSMVPLLIPQIVKADPLPAPAIDGVEPAQPGRSDDRTPFRILGSNFGRDPDPPGLTVTLKAPDPDGREWEIPRAGNEYREVGLDGDWISVQAGFYLEGTWKVWVTNPDGQRSNEYEFDVKAKPTAAIDEDLLDLIDTYLSDHKEKCYRDSWDISVNQYKAWIMTIAWAETRRGGYGAHSLIDSQDAGLPKNDVFNHVDQGKDFRFCTGIGPFQIDHGGSYGHRPSDDPHEIVYFEPTEAWASLIPPTDDFSAWSNWPTIKKLDPVSALETVLTYHFRRFTGDETLYEFWKTAKWVWYALQEDPNLGVWGENEEGFPWKAVTGEEWDSHKDGKPEENNGADLDWEAVRNQLAENAVNDSNVYSYDHYVEYLGLRSWDIPTREGRDISFQGWLPTWRITPHNHYGETWYGSAYYYTFYFNSETETGTEVWVMDNRGAEENELCPVFFREYTNTQNPWGIDPPVSKAGETLSSPALDPESHLGVSPVDVVLIIDDSGSMSWNDPSCMRRQAARVFIDAMQNNDRIGIVEFDGSATSLWPIQMLGADRTQVKNSLNSLWPSDGTSLSAGLSAGYQQLLTVESSGNDKAAVFLTDGVGTYNNEAQLYAAKGWPIYVLGLGSDIDAPLLQQIADDSGGEYQHLDDASQMQSVYNKIATAISGGSMILDEWAHLDLGVTLQFETALSTDAVIGNFFVGWGGSTVDLSLITPDGASIGPDTTDPNVYHSKSSTYELYRISNPIPGIWTLVIFGSDLPAGGEDIVVQVSEIPNIPTQQNPPVAEAGPDQTVERTGAAGAQVTLDGSASYDPDGDPLTYSWSWAGGGSASGVSPAVTMPMGTTTVTLQVSDGALSDTDTVDITVEDTTAPVATVEFPTAGLAVQDGIVLKANASDLSGVDAVYLYIREPDGPQGQIIGSGFEDMAATFNSSTGKWEYAFDTLSLPDGNYIALAKGVDTYANEGWSNCVPFSIRNWAVIELLPASQNNKAGRTMPVKFALRVSALVDPEQPFVWNDELTLKIYATSNPGVILQTSTFGSGSKDYRIDNNTLYITNFRTLRTPTQYTVEIWRTSKNFVVGSFTFATVK
jgi:hypothetical protein